jgi:hypothetical protein
MAADARIFNRLMVSRRAPDVRHAYGCAICEGLPSSSEGPKTGAARVLDRRGHRRMPRVLGRPGQDQVLSSRTSLASGIVVLTDRTT